MTHSSKPRLVVIDNDQRVLDDLEEFFNDEGYSILKIDTKRQLLSSEMLQQIKEYRPHIIILDLRLSRQIDDEDITGLYLLPKLLSARCILYSAFITAAVIDEAEKIVQAANTTHCTGNQTQVYRAYKPHDPAELINLVARLASGIASAKSEVAIKHPRTWKLADMARAISEIQKPLPAESIADILVQLYPQSRQITLETIDGNLNLNLTASRGRSLLLKLHRDNFEPVALKLTRTEDAVNECENYTKYIDGKLPGSFHTTLEKIVEFWDLGGSVYKFIGAYQPTISTFSQYYQSEADPKQILKPLEHLFQSVWIRLYNEGRSVTKSEVHHDANSLFELYDRSLNLRPRLERLKKDEMCLTVPSLNRSLLNPAWWLETHGDSNVILPTTFEAVTHGDLHGDNLFVENGYCWAIDFERTGWGHILRDFVELEVDIITRLTPARLDMQTFYELARTLAAPRSPREAFVTSSRLQHSADIRKAIEVIEGLRHIALSVTGYQDHREYLWGMLFDATFIATRRDEKIDPAHKERAIVFASVLAERLQEWNKSWSIK